MAENNNRSFGSIEIDIGSRHLSGKIYLQFLVSLSETENRNDLSLQIRALLAATH